jgi:hypothetical protein
VLGEPSRLSKSTHWEIAARCVLKMEAQLLVEQWRNRAS